MTSITVAQAGEVIKSKLLDIKKLFKEDMKFSFVARRPGSEEEELIITDDTDLKEVIKVIERSIARDSGSVQ